MVVQEINAVPSEKLSLRIVSKCKPEELLISSYMENGRG